MNRKASTAALRRMLQSCFSLRWNAHRATRLAARASAPETEAWTRDLTP